MSETMKSAHELNAELDSFQGIWSGGFFEGNPADPVFGLWGLTSFIGVSHAIWLACNKPHVTPTTTVLEIGCGRGAWTRCRLNTIDFLNTSAAMSMFITSRSAIFS